MSKSCFWGLALNDRLQQALLRHEDLSKAVRNGKAGGKDDITRPIPAANPPDDESDKDFNQLQQRSSRDVVPHKKSASVGVAASSRISPILPPPLSWSSPVYKKSAMIDFLSGDAYTVEEHPTETGAAPIKAPSGTCTVSSSAQETPPLVDKSAETSPSDTWEAAFLFVFNPAPTVERQSLRRRSSLSTSSTSDHIGESAISLNALTDGTWKLSLSSTESEEKAASKEAARYEDLLDFSKFR